MSKSTALPCLIATLIATSTANAGIDLIAIGSVGEQYADLAYPTAGALENGVAGNILGGLGSGLAHASGNTFLGLPDRGPNANAYNPGVDDTTSYINRFQTLSLGLAPSPAGAALPYTLSVHLTGTTLLASKQPLTYGAGTELGLPNGAPALNAIDGKFYFSGRSDNFDATRNSTSARNGRLDPEGIRVSGDGKSVWISDEYGPHVYQFSRTTGQLMKRVQLPAKFAVATQTPMEETELAANTEGRVTNKGMEGLAISPDGSTLFGVMQSPLLQDGGTKGAITRIVKIDLATGATTEYAYRLENIGTVDKPKYTTASEILAINNQEFLVDERDSKGLGNDSEAAFKRLYHINLMGAQDVGSLVGEANLTNKAVPKSLFLDLVSALGAAGIAPADIPAKLEGIAFGEDISIGGKNKHTLFIANDNDFLASLIDTLHPNGVDNPNKFFVFAIDETDMPGYLPQQVAPFARRVSD